MAPKPISRRKLIQRLRALGFEGPFVATRHEYMSRDTKKIFIPNLHGSDIGAPLLRRIIQQCNLSVDEWDGLE